MPKSKTTGVTRVTRVTGVRKRLGAGFRAARRLLRAIHVLTCVTLVTFVTPVTSTWAAEPFAAPRAVDPVTASPAGGLVQVTLSLLLVLAAVFAAAWAVRRLRGMGKFGSCAIEIVAEVALGQRERAVLIQVGKQQLLLGVAPGRVNTLHVLEESVAVTGGRQTADGIQSDLPLSSAQTSSLQPPPHLQFKAILKRSLGL